MKFRANGAVAIHVSDLKAAEKFYVGTLGMKLLAKSRNHLEFKLGRGRFYVNRDTESMPPILSFSVKNIKKARERLKLAGAKIIEDRGGSLYFADPLGVVFDIVED